MAILSRETDPQHNVGHWWVKNDIPHRNYRDAMPRTALSSTNYQWSRDSFFLTLLAGRFAHQSCLPMRTTFFILLVTVVLAALSISCSPDFDPYWKIDDLRVMAIQADPAVAMPGEPVTLLALVHAPADSDVDYDWSWCPFRLSAQDNYECPVDETDLEAIVDETDEDFDAQGIFDLGDDSQAVFLSPFEADEVRQFCEAIQREVIEEFDDAEMAGLLPGGDCSEGYEISVRLQVRTDDEDLIAAKRFLLWSGAEEYNENPVVEKLQLRPADEEDLPVLQTEADWPVADGAGRDEQWVTLSDDEPLRVVADVALQLRTLVDPESQLVYTPPTPRGAEDAPPEPRAESFVYRHFSTTGDIDTSRHLHAPEENTLEEASITELTFDPAEFEDDCPHFDDGQCRMRLWSVVRDGRLGVDWISKPLLVAE